MAHAAVVRGVRRVRGPRHLLDPDDRVADPRRPSGGGSLRSVSGRSGSAGDLRRQGLALDEAHREIGRPVDLTRFVNRAHSGVLELRDRRDLALEPLSCAARVERRPSQQLYGDVPGHPALLGLVDNAHPAHADPAKKHEVAELTRQVRPVPLGAADQAHASQVLQDSAQLHSRFGVLGADRVDRADPLPLHALEAGVGERFETRIVHVSLSRLSAVGA